MDQASNCSAWTPEQWSDVHFVKSVCGDLVPDTDIAGVGVLVGFVATSILTVFLSVGKAVCLLMLQKKDNLIRRFVHPDGPDGPPRWDWMPKKAQAVFWDHIFGKLVIGLADQQMVTGFAILTAAIHMLPQTAAYNFYIMAHAGAFALVTQSMGLLVSFDFIHKSLPLYAIRIVVYTATLGLFYTCAYLSYDLTGDEGYRAACPATCKFKKGESKFVVVLIVGLPIYAFILTDFVRELLRLGPLERETNPSRRPPGFNIFRIVAYYVWHHGFQFARIIAWLCTVTDLGVALWTIWTSWYISEYNQLDLKDGLSEKVWSFGQLVAVILVALPFLSIFEEWSESLSEEEKAAYPEGLVHHHHHGNTGKHHGDAIQGRLSPTPYTDDKSMAFVTSTKVKNFSLCTLQEAEEPGALTHDG